MKRLLGFLLLSAALLGCPGGGGRDGGAGGGGGGTGGGGGGSGDAGSNPLPRDPTAVGRVPLLKDSKLWVVGDVSEPDSGRETDFLATRFSAELALDTTFGSGGFASADFDGGVGFGTVFDNDFGMAAALDGDKVVVGGSTRGYLIGGNDIGLARFTATGQLDPAFGTGGSVVTPLGTNSILLDLAVTPTGKYLGCGSIERGVGLDFLLVRYNSDGTIDNTLSADGGQAVVRDFGDDNERCSSLILQGDKPVLAGGQFSIARLTASSDPDLTFGVAGSYKTDGNLSTTLARPDGRLLLVGSHNVDGPPAMTLFKLVQLSADGVPDPTFGTNGIKEQQIAGNAGLVRGAALQGDKLLVYFFADPAVVARFNADGSLDTTFGTAGFVTVPFRLGLFGNPNADSGHHLLVSGSTAYVVDFNLVDTGVTTTRQYLGVFKIPL